MHVALFFIRIHAKDAHVKTTRDNIIITCSSACDGEKGANKIKAISGYPLCP
jgi:hypothetical protein